MEGYKSVSVKDFYIDKFDKIRLEIDPEEKLYISSTVFAGEFLAKMIMEYPEFIKKIMPKA